MYRLYTEVVYTGRKNKTRYFGDNLSITNVVLRILYVCIFYDIFKRLYRFNRVRYRDIHPIEISRNTPALACTDAGLIRKSSSTGIGPGDDLTVRLISPQLVAPSRSPVNCPISGPLPDPFLINNSRAHARMYDCCVNIRTRSAV